MKQTLFNTGWTVAAGIPNPFAMSFGAGLKGEPVTLPHDAMVYEPRDPNVPGQNQAGFYPAKSYSYEKKFFVPEGWEKKQNILEFEGVMSRAMVYLNEELIATNSYGYSQFFTELNRFLRFGEENTLRVLALSHEQASRWYPGAGIYRDVRLWQGGPVYLEPEGIRIHTEDIRDSRAVINIRLALCNAGAGCGKFKVRIALMDMDGNETAACENHVSLVDMDKVESHMKLYVENPALWSPDHPALYQWNVTIRDGEALLDSAHGVFGIRTLTADAWGGLRINGVETKLRGACIHHDNGIIGAVTLTDAEEFRVQSLKQAGFNAIRSAHHPAGKALLEVCDRLGMLVMDELSDMWETPKNPADYAFDFANGWEKALRAMVSKDYCHPSVILYSLGNEIGEIGRSSGGRINRRLASALRNLDSTRLITGAISGFLAMSEHSGELAAAMGSQEEKKEDAGGSEALNAAMSQMDYSRMDTFSGLPALSEGMEEVSCEWDVVGYNYLTARHELEHRLHPERVVVGSETYPTEIGRLWPIVERNTHAIGDFTWTGYDYLGEAGIGCRHYAPERKEQGWYPDRLAYCGDINLNAYRRPVSYLREIAYGFRRTPYVAVDRLNRYGQRDNTNDWKYHDCLDSWTWLGYEGKPAIVRVLSSSQEVELFVNGISQGRKPTGMANRYETAFLLKYQPGELMAVGYSDGREDGRFALHTAGAPVKLALSASKTQLSAGGGSIAFITADLADSMGRMNHYDNRKVHVEILGCGILAGFGSAHPQCEGSYQDSVWETYDGRVMAAVRSTEQTGSITVRFHAEGCEPAEVCLESK